MKLVQFHDQDGATIAFDAEGFCYAHAYVPPPPPPGGSQPDLHALIICVSGHNFHVQEEIDKVYEILKGVA